MYSASDFEKLWFLYKTEGEPNDISISMIAPVKFVSAIFYTIIGT